MKKTLLMLVAFMATMTAFASAEEEGWQKSFTPVASADDLDGVHTAVASDGSVFASSTYNQAFTRGDVTVADPEGLTSSCVLKFDKDGNAKWAVTFLGNSLIHAMTVGEDGMLYIAGTSQDVKVVVTGTDEKHYEIDNPASDPWGTGVLEPDAFSAFIIKIDPNGALADLKVITPETNAAVLEDFECFYFALATIAIKPMKLVVDNGKLYVSARYMGDVKELGWLGAYVRSTEMGLTLDNYSYGVFALDTSLGAIESVANVQQTGAVSAEEYDVDALDFVIYGGVPHVAFIGMGKLTLTTATGAQPFEFQMAGESNNEHAMVLANVTAPTHSFIFHAAPNADLDKENYNLVGATIEGANCILSGTFFGNFQLDNSVTKDVKTQFVASIKMADCTTKWTWVNDVESEATCMIVAGEETNAATDKAMYTLNTETGEKKKTMDQGFEDAAIYNDQYVSTVYTKDNSVTVFSPKLKPSGIETLKAQKNGNAKFYNVNGMELAAPQKGLNIIKTEDGVKKVSVK